MLSAWLDGTRLYLAKGLAIVATPAQAPQVIRLPSTLAWDSAFARVTEALKVSGILMRPNSALRVMLSGALSPAVAIQAPEEASNWHDLSVLLPTFASRALGVPQASLRCAQDFGGGSIGAASGENLMLALHSWAVSSNLRLQELQPSWSVASQSRWVRSRSCTALQLIEPDGVTLIADTAGRWSAAHLELEHPTGATPAALRRLCTAWDVKGEQVVAIEFVVNPSQRMRHGPKAWARHWKLYENHTG